MENALRACCKGIKIGKILIHREGDNGQQVCKVYALFIFYLFCVVVCESLSLFWQCNNLAANLWKIATRHLRKTCLTIGSYFRDRFVYFMLLSNFILVICLPLCIALTSAFHIVLVLKIYANLKLIYSCTLLRSLAICHLCLSGVTANCPRCSVSIRQPGKN